MAATPSLLRVVPRGPAGPWEVRAPKTQQVLYAADREAVAVVLARPLSATEAAALDRGDILVTDASLVRDGKVSLTAPPPTGEGASIRHQNAGLFLPGTVAFSSRPSAFVSVRHLQAFDAISQPIGSLLYMAPPGSGRVPTTRDEARLDALLAADVGREFFSTRVERGPPGAQSLRSILVVTLAILMLSTAAVSILTIGLVSTELRAVFTALWTLGADRRMRLLVCLAHGLAVSLIASALGLLLGIAAAISWIAASGLPWTAWGLLAAVGAGVLSLIGSAAACWWFGSRTVVARTQEV